jgi:hypothetical protein
MCVQRVWQLLSYATAAEGQSCRVDDPGLIEAWEAANRLKVRWHLVRQEIDPGRDLAAFPEDVAIDRPLPHGSLEGWTSAPLMYPWGDSSERQIPVGPDQALHLYVDVEQRDGTLTSVGGLLEGQSERASSLEASPVRRPRSIGQRAASAQAAPAASSAVVHHGRTRDAGSREAPLSLVREARCHDVEAAQVRPPVDRDALEAELAEKLRAQVESEAMLEEVRVEVERLRVSTATLRSDVVSAERQRAQSRRELARARDRLTDRIALLAQAHERREQLADDLADSGRAVSREEARIAELRRQRNALQDEQARLADKVANLVGRIKRLSQTVPTEPDPRSAYGSS